MYISRMREQSIFQVEFSMFVFRVFLLADYLPYLGWRTMSVQLFFGTIPFSRLSTLLEMQTASSSIWTRVAVSISYDSMHYTTNASTLTRTGNTCLDTISGLDKTIQSLIKDYHYSLF